MGDSTTFFIYLPISEKQDLRKQAKEEKILYGCGKILVMDDEKMVRNIADRMLKKIGYEVVLAKDGAETIKLYKQAVQSRRPFEAVIMDLTIPGAIGGKEAIKTLLKINPEVKAIVSSGYANDPILAHFKDYGFQGVIPKPYSIEEMSNILYKVINEKEEISISVKM